MSIDDHASENTPVIKSRTGRFLQGIFDKKAPVRNMPRTRSTPTNQQEFMQVVPEPITWDEGEETNWDDDFVEAPQPAFIEPTSIPPATPPPISAAPPPPPPTAFQTAEQIGTTVAPPDPVLSPPYNAEPIEDQNPISSPAPSTTKPVPPALPLSTLSKADETARSATIEVSIPRPKNIKYKSKDPNAEPVTKPTNTANNNSTTKSAAIDLDIQRPKNIKYKTNSPVKVSLSEKLLAPIRSLFAKISAPFDQTAKIYIEQIPADGKIPVRNPVKKSWQLPSLGYENLRKILVIAGALFLAMTVTWAVINFWPRSNSVAITTPTPTPVVQPAVPVKPAVSPEAALVEAVKNRTQTLASQYPVGLIANLELDNQQEIATVTVGDLWYSLTPEQQQQTAQSLWQQARNYQMSGLEVRGTTDRLLARSPYVGTAAIVMSR